ncbi:hypothetical protein SDC9_99080 [bioreactor metagenome]|uniref:Uncharacterized protein n=1 Tax=bioreactor metagenome TaxID=1076179 RepID=A0A645AJ58_9ZZZZ
MPEGTAKTSQRAEPEISSELTTPETTTSPEATCTGLVNFSSTFAGKRAEADFRTPDDDEKDVWNGVSGLGSPMAEAEI